MLASVYDFLRRRFAPRITRPATGGAAAIRELPAPMRDAIEYRLAELGYGLRRGIAMRGVPLRRGERPSFATFREGTLFVDAGAVWNRILRPEFLLLDLPHALIDRPAVWNGGSPTEMVAARLAAALLSLRRIADQLTNDAAVLLGLPDDRLLSWLATAVGPMIPPPVRQLLAKEGREIFRIALERIEAAPAVHRSGRFGPSARAMRDGMVSLIRLSRCAE
jgi:hypothetical protein